MSKNYFIYGVAGAGKSWFSMYVKKVLDLPLVSADYIRSIAQLDIDMNEHPELHYNRESLSGSPIQDILSVRTLVKPYVLHELDFYQHGVIIEGTCLDPNVTTTLGKTFLIVIENEEQHYNQYHQQRKVSEKSVAKFKHKRLKQEYLIEEAKKLDVQIINNSGDLEQMLKQISDINN